MGRTMIFMSRFSALCLSALIALVNHGAAECAEADWPRLRSMMITNGPATQSQKETTTAKNEGGDKLAPSSGGDIPPDRASATTAAKNGTARALLSYDATFEGGFARLRLPLMYLGSVSDILTNLEVTNAQGVGEIFTARALLEFTDLADLMPPGLSLIGRRVKLKVLGTDITGTLIATQGKMSLLVDDGKVVAGDLGTPLSGSDEPLVPLDAAVMSKLIEPGALVVLIELSSAAPSLPGPQGATTLRHISVELAVKPWSATYHLRLADNGLGTLTARAIVQNPTLDKCDGISLSLRAGKAFYSVQSVTLPAGTMQVINARSFQLRALLALRWSNDTGRGTIDLAIANDQSGASPVTRGDVSIWSEDQMIAKAELPDLATKDPPASPGGGKCFSGKDFTHVALNESPANLAVKGPQVGVSNVQASAAPCCVNWPQLHYTEIRQYGLAVENLTASTLRIYRECDAGWTFEATPNAHTEFFTVQPAGSAVGRLVSRSEVSLILPDGLLRNDDFIDEILKQWQGSGLAVQIRQIYKDVIAKRKLASKQEERLRELSVANDPSPTLSQLRIASQAVRLAHQELFYSERKLERLSNVMIQEYCKLRSASVAPLSISERTCLGDK